MFPFNYSDVTGLVFVHQNPPSLLLSFWHAASTIAIGHPDRNLHAHVQVPSPPVISLTSIFLAAALASTAWSLILTLTLTLDPCATCCPLFPRTTLLHLTCKSQKPWYPLFFASALEPRPPESTQLHSFAHSPTQSSGLDCCPLSIHCRSELLACFGRSRLNTFGWPCSPAFPCLLIHYSPFTKKTPFLSTYNLHLSSFLHPLGLCQPISKSYRKSWEF